jgi:hypothetical protein
VIQFFAGAVRWVITGFCFCADEMTSMLRSFKKVLWVGLLAFGLQASWAFSLLGPAGNGGDAWQVEAIGYNPIQSSIGAPPGFIDPLAVGPKNLGEEYRRNTPVIYYTFDANFLDYFGSTGASAVDQAFAILNNAFTNNPTGMTNGLDGYSSDLSEIPLNTMEQSFSSGAVGLLDLKSETLSVMMEQLGLADSVRYTWALHNRFQPTGTTCPDQTTYSVIMRNFDIQASPLNQSQESPYINGELLTYFINEICNSPAAPPNADASEVAVDAPFANNAPVASLNEDGLPPGFFYTGLTRDDVGGLRWLLRSNNIIFEDIAPGSVQVAGSGSTTTNLADQFTLTTSSLTALRLASLTNGPVALQTLFPGLIIASVVTNFNGTFTYTFANVVTNRFSTNTTIQIQIQKTTIAPLVGSPLGSPPVTNTTTQTITIVSNIVSGDFFLVPTNFCGLNIIQTSATNVIALTNNTGNITNVSGSTTTITSTNIVIPSTNFTLVVAPCEFLNGAGGATNTTGLFQGIEKIQFVRANFDGLLGQFFQPITNQYKMVTITPSSQPAIVTLQRVVTAPDILFSAADLLPGPAANNTGNPAFSRNVNFDIAHVGAGLAGPGTILNGTIVTLNKVGTAFLNVGTASLNQSSATEQVFIWGSFDESTNDPVIYPNGTSIQDLENEVLIQISPASLPNGTNAALYAATTFTTTGGAFTPPYTWSLVAGSLPSGLTLSSGGTISGTPTQSGAFNFVIQLTDSLGRSTQWTYSITIH